MADPQIDPRLAGDSVSTASSYQQSSAHPYYSTYPSDGSTVQDHPTGGTVTSIDSGHGQGTQAAYTNSPGSPSDANSPTGDNAADAKRPRACDSCRSLKVRCDQDVPGETCKRCKKAGRQCIISEATRKRTRKADSRVAELEKKIDALTASLQAQGQGKRVDQIAPGEFPGAFADSESAKYYRSPGSQARGLKRRRTEDGSHVESVGTEPVTPVSFVQPQSALQQAIDPVFATRTSVNESETNPHFPGPNVPFLQGEKAQDQLIAIQRIDQLVNREQQDRIFTKYHKEMSTQVPAVVFPEDTSFDEIRTQKPVLFLAILNAGSVGILPYERQAEITEELVRTIAVVVIIKGEKSLELVQAIQITCFWFKPPPRTDMTNYYQLIHLAAVMAIDLGLGRPQSVSRTRNPHYRRITYPNSEIPESRRAWLACYFLCASTSMILRRPNLLKWDNYIEQCIEILEGSKEAAPTDPLLCAYIKVQHISETIGVEFGMSDPTAQISINDQKVKYQINEFERELKQWRRERPQDMNTPALELQYHVCNLYLHEIVMHVNHNIDDFRVPVTEESLKGSLKPGDKLTPTQINAITECQNAAIGILETYCGIEWDKIRCIPMFLYFVRIVYAFVILLKLYFAATDPESEIGKLIDPKRLRIDEFLDRVHAQIRPISGSETYRPYAKALFILGKLGEWYRKHKDGLATSASNGANSLSTHNSADGASQQQAAYGTHASDSGLQLLSSVATSSSDPSQHRAPSTTTVSTPSSTGPYPSTMPPPARPQTWSSEPQHPWPTTTTGAGNYNSFGHTTSAPGSLPLDPGLLQQTQPPMDLQFPPGLMDSLYGNWGSGFEESMDMTMNSWVEDLGKNLDYVDGVWPAVPVEEGPRM
ncbi:MAG: hypothetical protein M1822_006708 [Bathelium mastoideum]|nr:MAG: hypothetical protein M1822_006708 [Bathelium mastoideum]